MPRAIPTPPVTCPPERTADPIECLVCGESNRSSAERCRACSAPVSLARRAGPAWRFGNGHRTHLIAVVGAAGVGKTAYLGMLMDMLVRGVGGLRATLRGPQSIDLQETATTALASGVYPEKTSIHPEHWQWTHGRVKCDRRRRATEFVLADVAGDAWAEEADRPGRRPALPALLRRASALVVMVDAQRLHAGDHANDFVALKLLSTVTEQPASNRNLRRLSARPLALVVTKADACQAAIDDPRRFVESHAEAALRDCEDRFPQTRVFGASVSGASAWREAAGCRRCIPLRVEPQGVVEPFGWLLTQLP